MSTTSTWKIILCVTAGPQQLLQTRKIHIIYFQEIYLSKSVFFSFKAHAFDDEFEFHRTQNLAESNLYVRSKFQTTLTNAGIVRYSKRWPYNQFVTSDLDFRFSLPSGFGLKILTCRLRKIVTRHRRMRTCSSRVTFTFEVRHPTSPCDSRAPFELRLHRHT